MAQVLEVEKLCKSFTGYAGEPVRAVDDVSFCIRDGEFYTLLGPSGCGKTSTLRCVAGLEATDAGSITISGKVVSRHEPRVFVPPHRRDIGMVFQSYGVWPHMTVFRNVAFPLQVCRPRLGGREVHERVEAALSAVQLSGFEERMATDLSGGQQQRLALARALVRQPRLLLLDEPLSNLDARLREAMRAELRRLQRRLGITTLYVTHDQTEALAMSNVVAVMDHGRVVQEGEPRQVYERPVTRFVAEFVGTTNFIDGRVVRRNGDGHGTLEVEFGQVEIACPDGLQPGSRVVMSIRPEQVTTSAAQPDGPNVFRGVTEEAMFLGDVVECRVRIGRTLVVSRQRATAPPSAGDPVFVALPIDACAVVGT